MSIAAFISETALGPFSKIPSTVFHNKSAPWSRRDSRIGGNDSNKLPGDLQALQGPGKLSKGPMLYNPMLVQEQINGKSLLTLLIPLKGPKNGI